MAGDIESALAAVRQRESGNRNVYNYKHAADPTGYTASGYYQIIDPTWREGAGMAGVDTNQYPTAIQAPFDVQHAVAKALYAKYGEMPWAASAPGGTRAGNMGVADANLPVPPVPVSDPAMQSTPAPAPAPGPNPAAMAAAAQMLRTGNTGLSSIVTQGIQPMQDYYKSFFDPSNAASV